MALSRRSPIPLDDAIERKAVLILQATDEDAQNKPAPHSSSSCPSRMNAFSVAFGVKRTCRIALHMSAFDPKRTSDGRLKFMPKLNWLLSTVSKWAP